MNTLMNTLRRGSCRTLFGMVLLAVLLVSSARPVTAGLAEQTRSDCETVFNPTPPPGSWTTVCSGGATGGGTIILPPGGGGEGCTPGTLVVATQVVGGGALCEVWMVWYDPCTGVIAYSELVDLLSGGSCSAPLEEPPFNPCEVLTVTAGGVTCRTGWGIDWQLKASVRFPNAFLDLRPYPVTLVRWPSAARNGGVPAASGSDRLAYIAYGGGEEDDPEVGDWRKVRLRLRLTPASPLLFFTMPHLGTLALPEVGPTGPPTIFRFELPSHPEAGGTVLAGSLPGLGELPADMPLLQGSATSAYRLFWSLSYEKYVKDCRPGVDLVWGSFTCQTRHSVPVNDGHWEYEWDRRHRGGEITPGMVIGLPPGLAADLDGDGAPDAYWNHRITVRRMDDHNRIDDPRWQGTWTWGGAVYWGVREGQGQVGWR